MIDLRNYLLNRIIKSQSRCWIWIKACFENGYGKAWDGQRQVRAHRLAYEVFVGPVPEGKLVLHKCDVKCCINPGHLYIGDASRNYKDFKSRGDMSRLGRRRAPGTDLETIEGFLKEGYKKSDIARILGVSAATITHRLKEEP